MDLFLQNCRVDHLSSSFFSPVTVDVLRLDAIHPEVSGNKWFKLKNYLEDAKQKNKTTLLTFGGAFSNHIVATASAARLRGFKSIGIIRGGEMASSHTLIKATELGMKVFFISREAYRTKHVPDEVYKQYPENELYEIPEGGYGIMGKEGAGDILRQHETSSYTHFIVAVGTGTTLAGLVAASAEPQQVIGIPVLKNAFSLQQGIENLLPAQKHRQFKLLHDYHFGGYAKSTKELFQFMNDLYNETGIATDFVYTAKAFFAGFDLLKQGFFKTSDKILLVHTGGLQGNNSLPKGTLIFP